MGHHALVGFPDPIDHEIDQRTWLRLCSVQQMEKLIDEWVVVGERKPLEGEARDRRADRPMESRLDAVQNECTQTMGILRRVFERDRPTERDAQDRGTLECQMIDQEAQITGVFTDVTNGPRVALKIAPRETVSPQTGEDDIEVTASI